jgi:hypothetical protein
MSLAVLFSENKGELREINNCRQLPTFVTLMALASHNNHMMEHSSRNILTYIGRINTDLQKVDGWYGIVFWALSMMETGTYFNH